MRNIVRIKFGSHLYGTSTPASDIDFKSVFIPAARDILLQRATAHFPTKRRKAAGEKNAAGEIEEDAYSLQRYLSLLVEGQPMAIDMLFAPPSSMTDEPGPEWIELFDNRRRLLSKQAVTFVKYCHDQANKYGIKGSRVAAARAALDALNGLIMTAGRMTKIGDCSATIEVLCAKTDHMAIVEIEQVSGTPLKHWEVCGRKIQYTARLGTAHEVVQRIVDEYGQRALMAERNEGVDWKALSHAVRVAMQAIELLDTGHVTFPLPYAMAVLTIKQGKMPYREVASWIETLLSQVDAAAARSALPEKPDLQWIDGFVERIYGYEITGGWQPSGGVAA